jgi:hypothetical protein
MNKFKLVRLNLLLLGICVLASCGGGGGSNGNSGNQQNQINEQKSTEKSIVTFSINNTPDLVNDNKINIDLPYGTNTKSLVAKFSFTGKNVLVGDKLQISGVTANDFTNPVTYTVVANDNSKTNYTVKVAVGKGHAYITNMDKNWVSICAVDTTGALKDCRKKQDDFRNPYAITAYNSYLYVSDQRGKYNGFSICKLNADGTDFSDCRLENSFGSDGLFNDPRGAAINNGFLYVTNLEGNSVVRCSLADFDGHLYACKTLNTGSVTLNKPQGIRFYETSGNTYAYIVNTFGGNLVRCSVTDTNDFTNCTSFNILTSAGPRDIDFNGAYAYISSLIAEGDYAITKCVVNRQNGYLTNCSKAEGFPNEHTIEIKFNGSYLYANNFGGYGTWICSFNATGNFPNCKIYEDKDNIGLDPRGITFY